MMGPVIDSYECQKDSPYFRQILDENERDLESLETKLEKVVKQCSQMVSSGKQYAHEQEQLVHVLWDLSGHFSTDTPVQAALNKLLAALGEATKFQAVLVDQAARAITRNMNTFIKTDLKNLKESKNVFERVSSELDSTNMKAASSPKSKPAETEELYKQVLATRKAFRHTALDYVQELSVAQGKKRFHVVDALLSYTKAYRTFFHQGSDLCEDLKPALDSISNEVSSMRNDVDTLIKEQESRHVKVTDCDLIATDLPEVRDSRVPVVLHGYLFKRSNNAFKTWNRRYFTLQNNQLVYRKRSGEEVTVMEEDLRLCSVKPAPDIDRRHCFELLSPMKVHFLQAESTAGCSHWIETLRRGIGAALQSGDGAQREAANYSYSSEAHFTTASSSASSCLSPMNSSNSSMPGTPTPPSKQQLWSSILSINGNNLCCDCNSSQPRWASANLGITLCIQCSGVHRSLGVHFSRVKSLTLDDWDQPILKLLIELGNDTVNSVYEYVASSGALTKPCPSSTSAEREAWIKAKYVQKLFVKPLPASMPANSTTTENNWCVPRRSKLKPIEERKSPDHNISSTYVPDLLSTPQPTSVMIAGDNNSLFQSLPQSLISLFYEDSSRNEFDKKEFSNADPLIDLTPSALLARASSVHNLPVMCHAFALGASLSYLHPPHEGMQDNSSTALHYAIQSGSDCAVEYLLLNGAAPNLKDSKGSTPLHQAVSLCSISQVYRLLQHRNTDLSAADDEGNKALDLALLSNQPDLVALLRVASLSEHIDRDEVDSMMKAIMADLSREMALSGYNMNGRNVFPNADDSGNNNLDDSRPSI